MSIEKVLDSSIKELDVELDENQRKQLLRYISEISLFNPKYKLVGAHGEDIVTKHIADCLSAVNVIKNLIKDNKDATFCDLGSGAGLPGIVLAIAFKDNNFTLVERMTRRVFFLNNAIAALKLGDRVKVIPQDLKTIDKKFDIVTFRAFHPLFDILDDIDNITDDKSYICAYKAKQDTLDAELEMVEETCTSKWTSRNVELKVPNLDAERRLCILQKK